MVSRTLVGATLTELSELDQPGSIATTQRLVAAFTEDAARTVAAVRDALAADDLDEVRRLAHRLRGSAATLGAERLAGLAKVLSGAEAGDPKLADWSAAADDELTTVTRLLTRWLRARSRECN